jgi:hypothetical protein
MEHKRLHSTQILIYWTNTYTLLKNTRALLFELGLVVNLEKAKHIYMSGKQNTGQNDKLMLYKVFCRCDTFRLLRNDTAKLKFNVEEIKKGLISKNACYHSAQNSLSFPSKFKYKH